MKSKTNKHLCELLSYQGELVEIDELLSPMIKIMWELGIKTTSSCQGDGGSSNKGENWSGIYFNDIEEARHLIQLAFDFSSDEEKKEVLQAMGRGSSLPEDYLPFALPYDKWDMFCHPMWHQDGKISFLIGVKFPQSEIDNMTGRLKNAQLPQARFRSSGPDQ